MLKGLVSFLLIAAAIISFKFLNAGSKVMDVNNDFKEILQNDIRAVPNITVTGLSTGMKKVTLILCLLIGYLAITLIYSSNPAYGAQKIFNILISIVPTVFVFYYLLKTLSDERIKIFIFSITVITILTVLYILINYPFDQSTIYEYRAGRWSHVIYGRMISSVAVVLVLYLVSLSDKKKIVLFSFITSVAFYGTYLSAFRAGFIGLLLVGIGLLLKKIMKRVNHARKQAAGKNLTTSDPAPFSLKNKNFFLKDSIKVFLPFTIAAILIFTLPSKDIVTLRYDNMLAIDNLQFKGDPAIHSRLEAWELSWEIIKEHPIIGTGFGGFNGYSNIKWTKAIKYPHNIILEMTAEGGVVGLLVLCALLFVVFKCTYRYSPDTTLILIFAFWIALFSKELSNQVLLWMFIVFAGLSKDKQSK